MDAKRSRPPDNEEEKDSARYSGIPVLITGGLGFIGSNLARRLVGAGAKVTIVDSLIPGQGGLLFNIAGIEDRVKLSRSDLRDGEAMNDLVRGQAVLFNLAGQASHEDSMRNPYPDLDINCRAQVSILEACKARNPGIKIVCASTRQIYGRPVRLPVDESHPLHPVDVNGINKIAGEWYHRLYGRVFGMRVCVLRLTNTIGPRMRVKDARQTFLGIWIRRILEGEPFEVWDGKQLRDFTYVDDAVDALLAAGRNERADGEVFNVGGDAPVSLKALADTLVGLAGKGSYRTIPFPEERKCIEIGDYYADYSRIRERLGWEPKIPLSEALKKTLAFYRMNLPEYL
jgi:UDP-glucose 4-epimerase